jgi:hypothetical protein
MFNTTLSALDLAADSCFACLAKQHALVFISHFSLPHGLLQSGSLSHAWRVEKDNAKINIVVNKILQIDLKNLDIFKTPLF